MGDVVLASSAISYLRQRYRDADIHLCTRAPWHELFEGDTDLAAIHVLRPAEQPTPTLQAAGPWDCVVDLQNNHQSASLAARYAPGAPRACFNKLHGKRMLLLVLRIDTYGRQQSVVARYLRAAGWDGSATIPAMPRITVTRRARDEADGALAHTPPDLLALAPFCAWRNKAWPIERFTEVARHFVSRGWGVVVLGGGDDCAQAARLLRDIGGSATSVAGRLSLGGSAAVLQRCRVALGNDTGLMHLARAVGTPTVSIWGATTRHWGFYPSGEPPFRVLETPLGYRPCHAHGGNYCWRVRRPCLSRIQAPQAIGAIQELCRSAAASL